MRMRAVRTQEDPAEGAAEGEEPVERSLAHHARRTPNQIRDDDPHFFGEEGAPDQRVRVPVVLEARAHEQRRPDCRDEIGRDAYHEHGSRRHSRCARVAIWLKPLDLDHVVSVTEGSRSIAHGHGPIRPERSRRRSIKASMLTRPGPRKTMTRAMTARARLNS